jgi:hypothetical protein
MTNREACEVYAKIEYITKDTENNIVIGCSKRTQVENIIKMLKEFEGKEVSIGIKPYHGTVKDDKNLVFYIVEPFE